jgi:hypothetical protein
MSAAAYLAILHQTSAPLKVLAALTLATQHQTSQVVLKWTPVDQTLAAAMLRGVKHSAAAYLAMILQSMEQ